MIEITKSTDYHTIKEILINPVLFNCTYGQGNTELHESELKHKEWLLVEIDGVPAGCFEIRELTKITIEGHIFILPKYWNHSLEILNAGEQFVKELGYKTIFSSVPENCLHMLKFMARIKYDVCGQIKNGIIYKNKLVSLFLYTKSL